MQYVAIKQENRDGEVVFVVNAISLKNKNKSVVQQIPHPLGSDALIFKTLEEAKNAISRAGFSYILPDGKKETPKTPVMTTATEKSSYEEMILNAIKDKINSSNSNVAAAAILALTEFPNEETFEILFEMLGEENDSIRENAISGVCRYGKILQNKIIEALQSPNWVTRNSAISCIVNLLDDTNINAELFIKPLVKACDDVNPIVQSSALSAIAKVYQSYKKNQKV